LNWTGQAVVSSINKRTLISQQLQAALAGGDDELRKVVAEMSRRLTVLQVREQQTGRKAQLLQERETALRKVSPCELRNGGK